MGVQSTSYPVYEFERKPKGRRRRRISVVKGGDSGLAWLPGTTDYASRVRADGGTVEALKCVNDELWKLSSISTPPSLQTFTLTPGALSGNAGYDRNAQVGLITPGYLDNAKIYVLASFGANWIKLALGSDGKQRITNIPKIFVTGGSETEFIQMQDLEEYSYGVFYSDIQAFLNSKVGQTVEVLIDTR